MTIFNRNNIWFGIVCAILAPFLSYGVLTSIGLIIKWLASGESNPLGQDTMILTSIFLNLFVFIPYIRKEKYEQTGRGVMLVTFIYVVVYFIVKL